jgi:phage shock protein C
MTETKRLYRSRTDRKIAGVLGGLAQYLGIDATAARVLFIVLAIVTGGGALLAYPVLWLVMPQEPAAGPNWPGTTAVPPEPTA